MIHKGVFIFLFIILIIKTGLAFSISPAEVYLNGKINEKICQEIKIIEESGTIIIEDQWTENKIGEKNINLYNFDSKKFDLSLDYPKKLDVQNEEKINICLTGKKSGKYFGVLLLHLQEKPVGIGIWIKVDLMEAHNKEDYSQGISGEVISEEKTVKKIENPKLVIIFFMIFIILILIFVYILLNLKIKNIKLV